MKPSNENKRCVKYITVFDRFVDLVCQKFMKFKFIKQI